MIAVDTSAIMAIVLREPERTAMLQAITETDAVIMSAGTLIEVQTVCLRKGGETLVTDVQALMNGLGLVVVAVDEEQAKVAHQAFAQFGKGSGHPAGLNFGDLFSYALAKSHDAPLLFKGDDFAQTDLRAAL